MNVNDELEMKSNETFDRDEITSWFLIAEKKSLFRSIFKTIYWSGRWPDMF
jgi:hypothetical protein